MLVVGVVTACTGPAASEGGPSADPTGSATVTSSPPAATGTAVPTPTPTATGDQAEPTAPEATAPAPADGTAVGVVLTSSGWSSATDAAEVTGYVTVVEEGGTCTARLTRGDVVVDVAQEALPDATTTSCGTISVPHSRLTSGRWSAEIRYDSPASAGASERVEISVP